jgi:putative oxidoreductase
MREFLQLVFYSELGSDLNNIAFLIFRILFAFELFRVHGMKKFRTENGSREHIPNPLHLPEKLNGWVAVFSDTVVPFLIILGVATRIAVIPAIGVTSIGYFVVHRNDKPEVRDVPYIYTISLLLLLFLGAGRYSADTLIFYKLFN